MPTPRRMLGRRPPKRAPALRLARVLTGIVPAHPTAVDHFAEVIDWGMYGNDTYGDCGPTSVANERKLISRYLAGTEQSPTQDDVFDLYRRSGNPTFDPADPGGPGDGGVDMQTMCEALVSGGIGGVKALGFASVDVSNLDEVRAAVSIFGSLLLGVNLEVAQQQQTDAGGPWDYQSSGEWGGHAVLTGRYTIPIGQGAADLAVVTWAEIIGLTDAFTAHQVEEAWVVIWPEHLGTVAFQQGVDPAALASDYQALTGRPFPAQPQPAPPQPPGPGPGPTPTDVDAALAAALRHNNWVTGHHIGDTAKVAHAGLAWLTGKGL